MKTRTCSKCKVEKDISEFWTKQNYCKICSKEYVKKYVQDNDLGAKRYKERYAEFVHLKEKPCIDCGGNFHPCVMDFDHIRG